MPSNIKIKGKGLTRIINSKVIQSPLAGVTDKVFRSLVRKWAPDSLLFTEMVNATSLKLGFGVEKINNITNEIGPIGIQLFDNRPNAVVDAALESEDSGAYLIDINMGCPVKKIAKKGGGIALIKDPILAEKIVKSIYKAIKIPLTVKTRIGWSNDDPYIKIEDFLLRLQDAGASMLTIHGRTREQGFSGKANWDIIRKLKEKLEIPIIANGDICNSKDAIKCLNATNADGVMIGRGVLGAPWIIGEIDAAIKGKKDFKIPTLEDRLLILIDHLDELIKEKGNHGLLIARKHISWTCKDFFGASDLRYNLVRAKTSEEIKFMIFNTLKSIKS